MESHVPHLIPHLQYPHLSSLTYSILTYPPSPTVSSPILPHLQYPYLSSLSSPILPHLQYPHLSSLTYSILTYPPSPHLSSLTYSILTYPPSPTASLPILPHLQYPHLSSLTYSILTYPLVHDVGTLCHLDCMDVAPGTLHPQHLTVDQTNQHLPHLTLQVCASTKQISRYKYIILRLLTMCNITLQIHHTPLTNNV